MSFPLKEQLSMLYEKLDASISGSSIHNRTTLLAALSYLVTWIIYFIVLICGLCYGRIGIPRRTEFDPLDRRLIFPYVSEPDTFTPVWQLVIWSVLAPLIMMAIFTFKFTRTFSLKQRLIMFHRFMLALMCSISLELFVVSCIKNVASVARPDIISRCEPANYTNSRTPIGISFCNQSNQQILYEGFRSFPSGHSATVFASMTVQSLYSITVLQLYDHKGFAWKFIFCILYPLTVALVISFSRVSDNRHRVSDVLAGSVIGIISGISAFTFYFPWHQSLELKEGRMQHQKRIKRHNIDRKMQHPLLPVSYHQPIKAFNSINSIPKISNSKARRTQSY